MSLANGELAMTWLTTLSLLLGAIIHALPVTGVLGANWLQKQYGIEFSEPNTLLLMQHRALLCGVVVRVAKIDWVLIVFLVIGLFNELFVLERQG